MNNRRNQLRQQKIEKRRKNEKKKQQKQLQRNISFYKKKEIVATVAAYYENNDPEMISYFSAVIHRHNDSDVIKYRIWDVADGLSEDELSEEIIDFCVKHGTKTINYIDPTKAEFSHGELMVRITDRLPE